ncbi:MAG: hypothetical protein J7M18_00745 [Candidatus Eremiobacteraeota bacterium]|nr:hypothetical protein [Candidatus Eremiobacteraeota bacterium]
MKRHVFLILIILSFSLVTFIPAISSEPEVLIFLNNKEFRGYYTIADNDFYLDARAVLMTMPDCRLMIDVNNGLLITGGKEVQCISCSGDRKSRWCVSGKKLAELIGGTYRYNKDARILDIYTGSTKEKSSTVGFPPIRINSFLAVDRKYPAVVHAVSESMGKNLKMTVGTLPVEVFFVSTRRIQAMGGAGAQGYTVLEHQGGRLILARVYVTSEKCEEEQAYIIAHEFAHIWHDWKTPGSLVRNSKLVEGFAEWVAYNTSRNLGYDKIAARALENIAPVYHDGLRYYLDLEKRYGKEKVLRFVEGKFIP